MNYSATRNTMDTTDAANIMRPKVIEDTITWMEGLENEERRKLVNALKRTKTVIENPANPKLLLARKEMGNIALEAIVIKGEKHGKTRFSLEYIPKNDGIHAKDFLYPQEALLVSEKVKVERSNYAHRLKLAFMFLAGKHGVKDNTSFHYSTDGEHFTKAYKSKAEVPNGEATISHAQALEILKEDKKINPSAYESPAFNVSQTKVFRVSTPQPRTIYNEELKYSYSPHQNDNECKTSWIVISKSLEDNSPSNSKEKKAYYSCKSLYATQEHTRKNKNYKLVWPANQIKSLLYLLDLCKELILNQGSKTLGGENQFYAIIYEKSTSRGPDGMLYKGLIAQGNNKTEASKIACNAIQDIWIEREEDPQTKGSKDPKAITCLSLSDCSLLKYLIESENNNR